MKTASWSDVMRTVLRPAQPSEKTFGGDGPRPGGKNPLSAPYLLRSARLSPHQLTMTASTSHCTKFGRAMSTPMVPTMRAYMGAFAIRPSTMRSSANPSSGAKKTTVIMAEGTMGIPCPVFSWK